MRPPLDRYDIHTNEQLSNLCVIAEALTWHGLRATYSVQRWTT